LKKLLLLFVVVCPFAGKSQHAYSLRYQVDLPIATIGLGTLTAAHFIDNKRIPPSPEQIQLLEKDDIWGFDRNAVNHWSPKCDKVSDILLYSSITMPGLLFINKNVRHERYTSLIYLETMMLSLGVTSLVKELSSRYRPFVYGESAGGEMKTSKDARRSFFSGHTSLAASASFFTAKVYSDLNPDSRLKPLVWTSAFVLPGAVGVLRYCAGKHYPSDIIVGYLTGAAIGYLVPQLHRKMGKSR